MGKRCGMSGVADEKQHEGRYPTRYRGVAPRTYGTTWEPCVAREPALFHEDAACEGVWTGCRSSGGPGGTAGMPGPLHLALNVDTVSCPAGRLWPAGFCAPVSITSAV